jgi:hypothetical protein
MNTSAMGKEALPRPGWFAIPPKVAFALVLILWCAFGAALAMQPAALRDLWGTVAGLWLPIRAVVWLLFLPWMLGLWAWQSDWALLLRLGVVGGLAVATVAAFYPRDTKL